MMKALMISWMPIRTKRWWDESSPALGAPPQTCSAYTLLMAIGDSHATEMKG
jgi:hypothetical protein